MSPWKKISEIHEDDGTCVFFHIRDPCNMGLGSILDADFDEDQWTHFAPIPKLSTEEGERMLTEWSESKGLATE